MTLKRRNPFRLVGGTDTMAGAAVRPGRLSVYRDRADDRRKVHIFASYAGIAEASPAQLMHAVAREPEKAHTKLRRTSEALASLEATYAARHQELTAAVTKLSAAIAAVESDGSAIVERPVLHDLAEK